MACCLLVACIAIGCGDRGPIDFRLGETRRLSDAVSVFNAGDGCLTFVTSTGNQIVPDMTRAGCVQDAVWRHGQIVVGRVETNVTDGSRYFFLIDLVTASVLLFETKAALLESCERQLGFPALPPESDWNRASLFLE